MKVLKAGSLKVLRRQALTVSQPQPPNQLLAGKKGAEGELLGEERGAPGNGERGTQIPPASRKATLQRSSH